MGVGPSVPMNAGSSVPVSTGPSVSVNIGPSVLASKHRFICTIQRRSVCASKQHKSICSVQVPLKDQACTHMKQALPPLLVVHLAKASGPGFESPATTKIFSHFSFAFFQTPLGEKVSIYIIIYTIFPSI